MTTQKSMTIEDLRRDYPNVVNATIIGQFLKKDSQHIRNLAKMGKLPFATVDIGKRRSNYTFPTELFIAWLEGRL